MSEAVPSGAHQADAALQVLVTLAGARQQVHVRGAARGVAAATCSAQQSVSDEGLPRGGAARTQRFACHQLHAGHLAEGCEALRKLRGRDAARHAAHAESYWSGVGLWVTCGRAALARRRRRGCSCRAKRLGRARALYTKSLGPRELIQA